MRYLYCHPLFDERKCAHRFSYELAAAFAHRGQSLHRFDYFGTGEQEGNFAEVTLDSLRSDVARQMSKGEINTLVGLRFGASLAMDCILRRPDSIKKLVLIEPIVNGREYVEHLRRKQQIKDLMTYGHCEARGNSPYQNIEGFKTSTRFIHQLNKFNLLAMVSTAELPYHVGIVRTRRGKCRDARLRKLVAHIERSGGTAEIQEIAVADFWERIPQVSYQQLIEIIHDYCTA